MTDRYLIFSNHVLVSVVKMPKSLLQRSALPNTLSDFFNEKAILQKFAIFLY